MSAATSFTHHIGLTDLSNEHQILKIIITPVFSYTRWHHLEAPFSVLRLRRQVAHSLQCSYRPSQISEPKVCHQLHSMQSERQTVRIAEIADHWDQLHCAAKNKQTNEKVVDYHDQLFHPPRWLIDWLTALRHISTERLLVPRNVAK